MRDMTMNLEDFTRTAAAMVAENDAREFVADIERLIALLDAA